MPESTYQRNLRKLSIQQFMNPQYSMYFRNSYIIYHFNWGIIHVCSELWCCWKQLGSKCSRPMLLYSCLETGLEKNFFFFLSSWRLTYELLKNVELSRWIQFYQIPAILLTSGCCQWIRHQIRDKAKTYIQMPVFVIGISHWTRSWNINCNLIVEFYMSCL